MVRPFISYAPHRKKRAEWVAEMLQAAGFQEPILTNAWDPTVSRKKTLQDLERADCFLAIMSPLRQDDGQVLDPTRGAPWIEADLTVAIHREIPVALIWEKGLVRSPALEEMALASEEADFDALEDLLALAPRITAIASRMRSFFEKSAVGDYPFVCDKIRVVDRFISEAEWCELRTISLSAVKRAESICHSVDVGQDKAPGISVKSADPDRDLKVKCLTDPSRIDPQLVTNEDNEVVYRIVFTPHLNPGETIEYRHESHHSNIFPMTLKAVRERAKLPGAPPFMKAGYVGTVFDVSRPIDVLQLEIEAPLSMGLASPQVKVYGINTVTEIEQESNEIGNPESKPRLWKVAPDDLREMWTCQVTIRKPRIGCSFCLLVKPTK